MSAFSHDLDRVTYPRMERQDLTQGQLGSFKFTPTDEVHHVSPAASSRLAQQSTYSFGKDTRVGVPYKIVTTQPEEQCSAHNLPLAATSPTRFNTTYFDKFIKPDIAKSRLLLGPKALRAAVDSSPTSPQRHHWYCKDSDQRYRINQAQVNMSAQNRNGLYHTTASNPFPTVTPSSQGDMDLLHTSLVRALAAEQEAHQVTKKSLELEKGLRLQAEAEAQRYLEHNRSLIGSVNMLKSVIQHSMKKEEQASRQAEHDRFHKEVNEANPRQTLLHDAVKNLRKPELRADIKKVQSVEPTERASMIAPVPVSERNASMLSLASSNWQKRYNELMHSRSNADPESFSMSDPTSAQQPPTIVSPHVLDSTQLFNFDLIESFGSPSLKVHFSTPPPQTDKEMSSSTGKDKMPVQSTTEQASRREKSDETQTSVDTMLTTTTDKTSVTEDKFMVIDPESENVPKGADQESLTVQKSPNLMAMPFDAHVKWNQGPIFDDLQDKFSRLGHQPSIFSKYPVRYIPDKSDKNLYRTIMIDHIPEKTTCKEVLKTIRGGTVELIQLVGPIGKSTSFMTARVIFSYEQGARNVYKRGQHPGIMINGERVRVWQVLEATYPRTKEIERKIFEEGFTRVLLVSNAVKVSADKLSQKLAHQIKSGCVVEISETFDGLPMVEFTSIAECSKALELLVKDRELGGSSFDFDEDPCTAPYQV